MDTKQTEELGQGAPAGQSAQAGQTESAKQSKTGKPATATAKSEHAKDGAAKPDADAARQSAKDDAAKLGDEEAAKAAGAGAKADTAAKAGKDAAAKPEQQELEQLRRQLEQSQDMNLRLQAEIQNMHKRAVQEQGKAHLGGMLEFVPLLLETLDNLEKALAFYANGQAPAGAGGGQDAAASAGAGQSAGESGVAAEAVQGAASNSSRQSGGELPDSDGSGNSAQPGGQPDGTTAAGIDDSVHQGVELTYKTLQDGLQRAGIAEINPVAEKFNPEYHEALARVKIPGKDSGSVIAVIQKGYKLQQRLLRPAKVQVAE